MLFLNFDYFFNFVLHLNFQLSAIFANFFKIEDEVKGERGARFARIREICGSV
jgi:hypothetical protein